jgi:AbrB family looped-hinge helix DNA binding protein
MTASALGDGAQRDSWLAHQRGIVCRAYLRMGGAIDRTLGARREVQPYLGLLLELYLAELEGKTLYQASLATDDVASKPHRRAARLASLGAIVRKPDTRDHRRVDLMLTPPMRSTLEHLLDVIGQSCLELAREVGRNSDRDFLIPSGQTWYRNDPGTRRENWDMNVIRGKVISGGRIALPVDMRRTLGLQNGDTVMFALEGDEIRIRPARSALRRVQERLKAFAPKEGLVSEELIAERRAEASHD